MIGEPDALLAVPEIPIEEGQSVKSRFMRLNQLMQSIWKKWHIEYLNCMTERHKWNKRSTNFQKDQLVYVIDVKSKKPLEYPIGRVVELHKGEDGRVRTISIKLPDKIVIKSIHNVIPFPDVDPHD